MRKRFKVALTIITILIIIMGVTLVSFKLQESSSKNSNYKEINSIPGYGYTLEDRDTLLMQENFEKLKDVLSKKEIDYEKYAEYLSKLFIIDLFTLNNKDNKYDVGSTEYVFPLVLDNYKLNVEDTVYKYIIDINNSSREIYAIVKSIELENIEDVTYKYNDVEYSGYEVELKWNYEKDFGYDNNGKLILINDNNKLYVVSYKGSVEK